MTVFSIKFVMIMTMAVFAYYIFPLKYRWFVLLVSSIAFYLQGGMSMFVIVLITSVITYVAAIKIEKIDTVNRKKQRFMLMSVVFTICGLLVISKIYTYFNWKITNFVIPIGISYYTFSMISYLADVYWKRDKAEQSFFKYLLFILFFPQIMQDPISRHNVLGDQLY